ncbi:zinc finger protein 23-like [Drosophila subpulchrella]|uniref:zinc finger protein 23-like n=1 Tax=Drosophila subpulchrella TaxID=1486046 RepID=UPI0018A143EF|nr:zinc finger protein 23-like [Drosophila subpulchrella]
MKERCRVCMLNSQDMINIFDGAPESGIPIVDIIAHHTGLEVKRGNLFPETVCKMCLQDAQNSYKIGQTSEQIHHLPTIVKEEKEVHDENLIKEAESQIFLGQVKEEVLHEELDERLCFFQDVNYQVGEQDSHCLELQLKNEPIEDDFQEEVNPLLEIPSDQPDERILDDDTGQEVKSELIDDYFVDEVNPLLEIDGDQPDKQVKDGEISKARLDWKNSYKCSYCQISFRNRSSMMKHFLKHTGERPYKCSQCSNSYKVKESLLTHMMGEEPFKCPHCSKGFVREPTLKKHLSIHTGERPFKCSLCSKTFRLKEHLKRHNRCHTGERPYQCDQCEKSFADNSFLTVHKRTHTGERPYKCPDCLATYMDSGSLRKHRMVDTIEPFNCDHCDKTFRAKGCFNYHIRSLDLVVQK